MTTRIGFDPFVAVSSATPLEIWLMAQLTTASLPVFQVLHLKKLVPRADQRDSGNVTGVTPLCYARCRSLRAFSMQMMLVDRNQR
jgi:hypothetical protein